MVHDKSLYSAAMNSGCLFHLLGLSLLVLLACSSIVEAHPISPLLSEASLEQIRQSQQPLPSMANYWRPRRSLASGRWGLRPGKRASNDVGSDGMMETQGLPKVYLLLASN